MAAVNEQLLKVIEPIRALIASYQKQHELVLDLLECCYWEVKHSRPNNHTGFMRDKIERNAKREALLDALESLLASAGRDLSAVRSARAPATNTGD